MSASLLLLPRPCGRVSLLCGILIVASAPLLTAGRWSNCSHPLMPEHGGFRCDPSPCRGFPSRSSIRLFCEPGYHMPNRLPMSRCHREKWTPPIPACIPIKDGTNNRSYESMPSMATTAVGVSIFLLTTTACLVIKSRLYPCHSNRRRSSDQCDLMVDGLPVSLPSYEEAVYGTWGQRIPVCASPGPTQLLLAQEDTGHLQQPLNNQSDDSSSNRSSSPGIAPPPYEELQSRVRTSPCQSSKTS
ncbi:sushi domain-containing protein 6 isoform X2 [Gouania willdenowi]|uniref:Sushi domain-containing protein 6-like n=1 Tax=Gouania willdenowi TaxID=441366 RepID=A0A8C5DZK9_GOUWI|nr:sushi domain-containing protein 6-like isoform X2 [Gouania willdenowi]